MKILIACECSGIVRDAFIKKGHDVISCDLLPDDSINLFNNSKAKHYQGNILNIINDEFDLMVGFPPCTFLSNAGIGWFNEEKYGQKAVQRKQKRLEAFEFVLKLWNAPINKICLENPVGWLNSHLRKPDQIIHPYYFSDDHKKRTCLWLKNLPKLIYTKGEEPKPLFIHYRKSSKYYKGGEIKKRYFSDTTREGKIRSRTFKRIANAMAEQWG